MRLWLTDARRPHLFLHAGDQAFVPPVHRLWQIGSFGGDKGRQRPLALGGGCERGQSRQDLLCALRGASSSLKSDKLRPLISSPMKKSRHLHYHHHHHHINNHKSIFVWVGECVSPGPPCGSCPARRCGIPWRPPGCAC